MKVVIFGGPKDGESITIPDNHRGIINFVKEATNQFMKGPKAGLPISPFGEIPVIESWNLVTKVNYWTQKEYTVVIEPTLEKWIIESFGDHKEEEEQE